MSDNIGKGGLALSALTILITLVVNYGVIKFNEGVADTKVKAISSELDGVKTISAKTSEALNLQIVLNTSQEVRINHLTHNTEKVIKGLEALSTNINNLNTSFAVFNAESSKGGK